MPVLVEVAQRYNMHANTLYVSSTCHRRLTLLELGIRSGLEDTRAMFVRMYLQVKTGFFLRRYGAHSASTSGPHVLAVLSVD